MKLFRYVLFVVLLLVSVASGAEPGVLQFNISNRDGRPIPCRIHLADDEGKPVEPTGQPFWHDHFVCSGRVSVKVAPGKHNWVIERGPEWESRSGRVTANSAQSSTIDVTLKQLAELQSSGWYSADLHVHRPVEQIEQLMLAEDLDFAPVIGWWNTPAKAVKPVERTEFRFDGHRVYTVLAGEDEREGGALLYFGLDRPLDLSVRSREFPSPMRFVEMAHRRNPQVWIDIEKPFWWDAPTWLATGKMNSVGLANNHMCRSTMLANEAWGKPRNVARFPGPLGNGYWTQEIYYHMLNAGLRLPPSAGSASGVLPNPVGYNRVYVQLGDRQLTRDHFFDALAKGNCFVTNGPLLRVTANRQFPGTEFVVEDDPLKIDLKIELTSREAISALEVIQNGKIVRTIECKPVVNQSLSAKLSLDPSGWFLVRAITDVEQTFRFASTAPWFFNNGADQSRISRKSAQFFLDWVEERIERVATNVPDLDQRDDVLYWHLRAREFWRKRLAAANAE